jgi:hypothetical protein
VPWINIDLLIFSMIHVNTYVQTVVFKMSTLGYKYIDVEPSLKNLTTNFGRIPEKQYDVCGLSNMVVSALLLILW